jgi:pimeloyl-ACP methyl ester carboxylesterase
MSKRHGHGAVLFDLPGHGAKVDVPLTLEACAGALQEDLDASGCLQKRNQDPQNHKLVYVGGSLGAYVGFFLLDKFRGSFDGAVLMDCGQNVGPGASLKARLGLVLLKWLAAKYSNYDLMNLMVGVTKKSKADYKIVETCFGAGNFFEQGAGQVECLRGVAPADHLPNLPFPILFLNGSEDHRDSEKRWLALSPNPKSELKTYEGGDHFFSHDTRFLEDVLGRMHDLAANKI